MPTFLYAKLVRDNIPDFHKESGHTLVQRQLKDKELIAALVKKLHEEADEVDSALSRDELVEELADVQQIIDDLCIVNTISKDDITTVITAKAARKGGFLQGQYIETVTMPNEDDKWVAYCRNSPDKYPEVTEAA